MSSYMTNVVGRWTEDVKLLTIYDQLNPRSAKYYRKNDAIQLLRNAGFQDIKVHHRHSYSWSVSARKL